MTKVKASDEMLRQRHWERFLDAALQIDRIRDDVPRFGVLCPVEQAEAWRRTSLLAKRVNEYMFAGVGIQRVADASIGGVEWLHDYDNLPLGDARRVLEAFCRAMLAFVRLDKMGLATHNGKQLQYMMDDINYLAREAGGDA